MVDFIYDFIQSLSGIIPRNGFCHHWALFVIEICFEEAITRRRCFGRGGKIYSNGCRFADDLIRRVHNEDASLSLSYSVSSSLSSKCMPSGWPCFAVSRILKKRNFLQIHWRRHQDYCGFHYITGTSSEASCQLLYCDDNYCFLYMLLQLFTMHKPRLQAPSDYISDVFDSLDPWPQQYSCSFRFKWLELIVPWGSSVIYRPGTLLLLRYPGNKSQRNLKGQ